MDIDDAMVGRILTRRELLHLSLRTGLGAAAICGLGSTALARRGSIPPAHLVASPVLTEGPFFVDEHLHRSDLIAGSTRHSVKNGIPLELGFTIYKLDVDNHAALTGAHVDVWHADAAGVYSDENNPMNHEDTTRQTWLRGYQVTDSEGEVKFRTIFPGWYSGRTPHIHFKIRTYSSATKVTAEFTSQVFFKDADATRIYRVDPYMLTGERDTSNANDNVFNERQHDGTVAGDHMLLDLKKLNGSAGYSANFTVVLTNQTMHAGRGRRPGGPGGPPPGGFGGPPPDDFGGPPPAGII